MDTTVEIANKVGAAEIISRVVDDLKDEAEQYRKMVMETIEKIMSNLGSADVDSRLEEQLIDGILYAFQEQTTEVSYHSDKQNIKVKIVERFYFKEANFFTRKLKFVSKFSIFNSFHSQTDKFLCFLQDVVMLNGFGTVVNALGKRVKPYLPQICGTILWRLNNKSAKVRQQAADLIARIAIVMKTCQEVKITNKQEKF